MFASSSVLHLFQPCFFSTFRLIIKSSKTFKTLRLTHVKHFSLFWQLRSFNTFDEINESVYLEREFEELTVDKYCELITDDNVQKEIQNILSDYELIKYETGRVPTTITIKNMKDMLELKTHQAKLRYFNYMFKTELKKAANLKKKIENKSEKAKNIAYMISNNIPFQMGINYDSETGAPLYGKWRVNYFLNITRSQLTSCYNSKLVEASLFGQKLVLDFDFEDCMEKREIKNTVLQATIAYANNRKAENPFDFWFCNLKPNTVQTEVLNRAFGIDRSQVNNTFINFTSESYHTLFPSSQIIYLSPNAKESLSSFDHNAVYVIGALVDRTIIKPITFAKCKKEKIKCYKLPLDDYFSFKTKKVLTIDQIVTILLELKESGDMYQALKKGIPPRKIKTDEELAEELKLRMEKLSRKKKQMFTLKRD